MSDHTSETVAAMPPTAAIGSLIRTVRRKDLGMRLKDFATAVGVHQSSLSALENGARPSRQTVEKLASFLGRPVRDLDPEGWAFDRQAPRRVNAAARSPQHAALLGQARNTSQ